MTRKSSVDRLPRPITPQKVRAVLRKEGLTASKSVRLARDWFQDTDGYSVWDERSWRNPRIRVVYHGLIAEKDQMLARIAAALSSADIAAEVRDGAVWVRVDQAEGGKVDG